MADELAYVYVTDGSLARSHTGYIMECLLGRTNLQLVNATMFAPSDKLLRRFASPINIKGEPVLNTLFRDYILNLSGMNTRGILLLLQGENAQKEVERVVGSIKAATRGNYDGVTIRGRFAGYTMASNDIISFEPAVLIASQGEDVRQDLETFVENAEKDSGVVDRVIDWDDVFSGIVNDNHGYGLEVLSDDLYPDKSKRLAAADLTAGQVQKTLVMLKPQNIYRGSTRVGQIINLLSGTGRKLVGIKVLNMSVAQAMEFYAHIPSLLEQRLGAKKGEEHFNRLIKYMTGFSPQELPQEQWGELGTETEIVLVYSGFQIIPIIRNKIGPTDPSKAQPGNIRYEYGTNIMENAVHASDSKQSFEREARILNVADSGLAQVVKKFYGS